MFLAKKPVNLPGKDVFRHVFAGPQTALVSKAKHPYFLTVFFLWSKDFS